MEKKTKGVHRIITQINTIGDTQNSFSLTWWVPCKLKALVVRNMFLYVLMIFSRYSSVDFLREKSDALKAFTILCTKLQREKEIIREHIMTIRSNHGREVENKGFTDYCEGQCIAHQFSSSNTPQQNVVVKGKNRTIQEARVMIIAKKMPLKFCAEAVNTTCCIFNKVSILSSTEKTCYEPW